MTGKNAMDNVRLEKVTLNIGCGDDKERIEKAQKLLQLLAGVNPVVTVSQKRSTFGVAKGRPLGAMATLRRQPAADFLKRAFYALDNKLRAGQLSSTGNFSFGIKEYIDIQGMKYSHDVGMMGLDVCVTLEKPGYRVKKRKVGRGRLGRNKGITRDEVAGWLRGNFGVDVVE